MSSHILTLWPFVLKRTLLQEREAGDYALSNASFWLSATRFDLKSARRELEEMKAANEALNIAEWRTVRSKLDEAECLLQSGYAQLQQVEAENAQLRETNAFLGEQDRKLRADLKAAADTILRLKDPAAERDRQRPFVNFGKR